MKLLVSDLNWLLDQSSADQTWRRNFVRSSSALVEGYSHCLREMCKVASVCEAPAALTADETSVISNEGKFGADDRIRLALRAAYKLFVFEPAPDFSGTGWQGALAMLACRDRLMHPKSVQDLLVADGEWPRFHVGATWLIEQFVAFVRHFGEKANAG